MPARIASAILSPNVSRKPGKRIQINQAEIAILRALAARQGKI